MRKSTLQLYAPFLALVLVQALVITVAPSTGSGGPAAAPEQLVAPGDEPALAPDEVEWDVVDGDDLPGAAGEQGSFDPGPSTTPGGPGDPAPARPGASPGAESSPAAPGQTAAAAAPEGDTSHCTRDGRQHGFFYHAPPCVPKWPDGADNGGPTYQGVTPEEVRVVFFLEQKNEQLAALLSAEGLARTPEQERAMMEAAEEFVNAHYEFYGRQVRFTMYHARSCPETPPDIPACRAEARRVADELQPFMVIWPVPTYPEVFDEWARRGIISLGGWHFDERYFTQRRPYRYDLLMDGTQTVDHAAEYYCKKLAGQNATHSGRVIHPEIGVRGQVPRRVGIITPENEAYLLGAQRLQQRIAACDDNEPIIVTYVSDIEQSASQTASNIGSLIDAGVTTVMFHADPIVPIFRSYGMTRQGYYPEHLLVGGGLLDYDKVGRLYDPSQWVHAFGPSHLNHPLPIGDQEASIVWRESGRSGDACGACQLSWSYYNLASGLIQGAGPNLDPQTVERGAMSLQPRGGWEATGGQAHLVLGRFGQGDYTYVSDVREVHWSRTARSPIDGRPGAYVGLDRGRRYVLGQWSDRFEVPVGS